MQEEYVTVCGSVESITYKNSLSGFTVLQMDVDGELLCVVGQLLSVEVGEELKVTGSYRSHPTYGRQFQAQLYERDLPATDNAICKYLSSGVVKGIGVVTARRIVDKFGKETFKIIEETPERLAEVSGITKKKAETMATDFKQVFGIRSLMLFLGNQGMTPMQSVTVYKKWGVLATEIIKENPYRLITENLGVEFEIADKIGDSYNFSKDCSERVFAGLYFVLLHNTRNGHTCLPREKLVEATARMLNVERETASDCLDDCIVNEQLYNYIKSRDLIYLPEYYSAQKYICNILGLMAKDNPVDNETVERMITVIEEDKKITYEEIQKKAIKNAIANNVFILTGGPGTGKTTTVNGIIDILEANGQTVLLAAPTGRAAKRLSEVTNHEAKTIHRLLEVKPTYKKTGRVEFVHDEQNPLLADAVIVDEMSMIDVLLFESLLRGIKAGAKLVMVGDYNQLPSVGAGNVLRDIIASDTIPTVMLSKVFRQAAKSAIVTNAHKIVNGEMPDLLKNDNDFFFMKMSDLGKASELIKSLCKTRLPNAYKFSPFDDIQVLCPSRIGELGTAELNTKLQSVLNPKDKMKAEFKFGAFTYRVGDKVMQIKNNYDVEWTKENERGLGIFNGDIGVIRMIDNGSKTMSIDFDKRLVYYPFDMAAELELAYAVTVHKSQGSEFEAIILPVMDTYKKLCYRNLLYTAVTRARKILVIVGDDVKIKEMVDNNKRLSRFTGFKDMLEESVLNG